MRLLILGGTWFLGRTVVADALAQGWQVTAFTRGRSGEPVPGVRHVRGDRRSVEDLARLGQEGPWDATVDTSAYEPSDVVRVLAALGGNAGRYVLISTVSAYRHWPSAPVNEESELWPSRLSASEADPDIAERPEPFQYGTLKSGCELAARTAPGGSLIVRPGVILGPGEYVGRMLTLLGRAAKGRRWLLAGPAEQLIQPVDVRDVARFLVDRIEAGDSDIYNLTAPPDYGTYGDLIRECIAVTGGHADLVWADPGWLVEQGVRQWTEIPLWRMPVGTWSVDSSRARGRGFVCRPLAETVVDAYQDLQAHPPVDHPRQAEHGMAADREADLLVKWDARVASGA